MSRSEEDEALVAIPRLAEDVGVTPRVLRYWEEQGIISPSREHGKLRYGPRDLAIARLVKRLLDGGVGIEGIRMLRRLAERDVRVAADEEVRLVEIALGLLYARKAFREVTGEGEERFLDPGPPHPPHGGPNDRSHGPPPPPHGQR